MLTYLPFIWTIFLQIDILERSSDCDEMIGHTHGRNRYQYSAGEEPVGFHTILPLGIWIPAPCLDSRSEPTFLLVGHGLPASRNPFMSHSAIRFQLNRLSLNGPPYLKFVLLKK